LKGRSIFTVRDDDDDDPVLVHHPEPIRCRHLARGLPVRPANVARPNTRSRKRLLQIELLKVQKWSQANGLRHVIVFEGRDAAGKGRQPSSGFMEHLNPRGGGRVVALEKPTERERTQWYFPALRQPPACRRRDRVVRPILVQTGRGVERVHGLLHTRSAPGVRKPGAAFSSRCWSTTASSLTQAVVLGHAVRNSGPGSRSVRSTQLRQWKLSPTDLALAGQVGRLHRCQGGHVRAHRHRHRRRGRWSRATTRSGARVNAMRLVLGKFDYDKQGP